MGACLNHAWLSQELYALFDFMIIILHGTQQGMHVSLLPKERKMLAERAWACNQLHKPPSSAVQLCKRVEPTHWFISACFLHAAQRLQGLPRMTPLI